MRLPEGSVVLGVKAIRVAPLSPASSSYTPAGPQALDGAELLHSLDGYQWEVVQQLVPFADTRLSTETRIVMEPKLFTRFLRIARRAEHQQPLALGYLLFECNARRSGDM